MCIHGWFKIIMYFVNMHVSKSLFYNNIITKCSKIFKVLKVMVKKRMQHME